MTNPTYIVCVDTYSLAKNTVGKYVTPVWRFGTNNLRTARKVLRNEIHHNPHNGRKFYCTLPSGRTLAYNDLRDYRANATKESVMPKRLNKNQRSALLDIIGDVNSEDICSVWELMSHLDYCELPQWFADWTIYSAGENMPGYMPNSPYCLFLTERSARGYCRELEYEEGFRDSGNVTNYMPVTLREVLS